MKVIDLRDALRVLGILEDRHLDVKELIIREQIGIGLITEDVPTQIGQLITATDPILSKGKVVLWRRGEKEGVLTIEFPMTPGQIMTEALKQSWLVGYGTTVGVPEKYISNILLR